MKIDNLDRFVDHQKSACCNDSTHNKFLCIPANEKYIPNPDGVGVALLESMRKHSNKVIQIDSVTGKKESYGDMLSRCISVAQNLEKRGLTPGDVVSVCTMNNLDCYPAAIASFMAGARISALDPVLSIQDTVYLINMLSPKFIFCDYAGLALLELALKETDTKSQLIVFGETKEHISFSDMQAECEDESSFQAKRANDVYDTCVIYFSSGTTGQPKGISVPHYAILYNAMQNNSEWCTFAITRICWLSATITVIQNIINGGRWVICPDYNVKDIMRIIQDFQVTYMICPPFYAYRLTKNLPDVKYDTSSLQLLVVVGGVISGEQILSLRDLFPSAIVFSGYGLTETTGAFILFNRKGVSFTKNKPSSIGRVLPGACVKIVDVETEEELGPNVHGEIRVKNNMIMNGYYKNPEITKQSFDKDGYFRTGDIAYYDDDYCFYIVDRIKDMMKFRSFYVVPSDLEQILLTHPDVSEAVVFSKPHPEDIDHPMAIVKLMPGAKSTPEEIQKFVDDQVVDYRRLRGGVKFVDNIPKTATCKQQRRCIRQMVLNGEL